MKSGPNHGPQQRGHGGRGVRLRRGAPPASTAPHLRAVGPEDEDRASPEAGKDSNGSDLATDGK